MNQKIKFPRSEKVYLPGTLFPELRVAMRKVEQVPSTNFVDGEKVITPNPEVYVYDTSGPFSDPAIEVDLKKGLPRLREPWILKRGDVEQLPEITSEYGRMRRDDRSLDSLRFEHITLPYRALQGKCCTQMYYAKQGIITPEMEYVAIRENMNWLLGWNPGTEQEIFSLDELVKAFDISRCSKAGAKFDFKKGIWFNHEYILMKSDDEIANLFAPIVANNGVEETLDRVKQVVHMMKDRVNFVYELWPLCSFFFIAPTEYDAKTAKKRWKEYSAQQMTELADVDQSVGCLIFAANLTVVE